MIYQLETGPLEVVHIEPDETFSEIEIEIDNDAYEKLDEIEKVLKKDGLTLNDFFIAVIKQEIDKHKAK